MKVEIHYHLWMKFRDEDQLVTCLTKEIDFEGIDYLNVGMKLRLNDLDGSGIRRAYKIEDIYAVEGDKLLHIHINEYPKSSEGNEKIKHFLTKYFGWKEHIVEYTV